VIFLKAIQKRKGKCKSEICKSRMGKVIKTKEIKKR